jgi:hypothetical protein
VDGNRAFLVNLARFISQAVKTQKRIFEPPSSPSTQNCLLNRQKYLAFKTW